MNKITDDPIMILGILAVGFIIGVIVVCTSLDDNPRVYKDADGLHVSYQEKLFRLVEINKTK